LLRPLPQLLPAHLFPFPSVGTVIFVQAASIAHIPDSPEDLLDGDLVGAYLAGRDAAFTQLVRRHQNLVYSVCLRRLRDPSLAEDAAQAVFIILVRKARSLRSRNSLAGWLFNTARLAASNAARTRNRRRKHEQEAAVDASAPVPPPSIWSELEPEIDDAMARLSTNDREAILLRFFEDKSHREVGAALGISEDAAKTRTLRALDRLRDRLHDQGVSLTSAVLAPALLSHATSQVPPTFAIATAQAASGAISTPLVNGILATMAWGHTKAIALVVSVALALGGGALIYAQGAASRPAQVVAGAKAPVSNAEAMARDGGDPRLRDQSWRPAFDALYRLAPGENLKRIAPPYIPERVPAYREFVSDAQYRAIPKPADSMHFEWFDNGQIDMQGYSFGNVGDIATVLTWGLGLKRYDIQMPPEVWKLKLTGDWITRKGATQDQLMADLGEIITKQGPPVRIERRKVPREVFVVTGRCVPLDITDPTAEPFELYSDKPNTRPAVTFRKGSLPDMIDALSQLLDRPVFNQTEATPQSLVAWRVHSSAQVYLSPDRDSKKADEQRRLLLGRLSTDSGLKFKSEMRPVDTWVFTKGAAAATQQAAK
jgi:RNA polymerase sigma factor (sigma-70 family)